jgi:hypothetical protein
LNGYAQLLEVTAREREEDAVSYSSLRDASGGMKGLDIEAIPFLYFYRILIGRLLRTALVAGTLARNDGNIISSLIPNRQQANVFRQISDGCNYTEKIRANLRPSTNQNPKLNPAEMVFCFPRKNAGV